MKEVKRDSKGRFIKGTWRARQEYIKGEDHHNWKGSEASYRAIHYWIERELGKPKKCSLCGTQKSRIQWANIDHKYRRVHIDYFEACPSCHKKYDIKMKKENFV